MFSICLRIRFQFRKCDEDSLYRNQFFVLLWNLIQKFNTNWEFNFIQIRNHFQFPLFRWKFNSNSYTHYNHTLEPLRFDAFELLRFVFFRLVVHIWFCHRKYTNANVVQTKKTVAIDPFLRVNQFRRVWLKYLKLIIKINNFDQFIARGVDSPYCSWAHRLFMWSFVIKSYSWTCLEYITMFED